MVPEPLKNTLEIKEEELSDSNSTLTDNIPQENIIS